MMAGSTLIAAPAHAREVVTASAPQDVSVTVYRDPERGEDAIDLNWLNGFALISETRTVTLPAGATTIRFDGVAESMVAVSAIVTGLPGTAQEKNRNAQILSPAALVDGSLGNRVTITRTNPATGEAKSEQAQVRTRADGGLVLQTAEGYEAVRCAGLPEKLTFASLPDGLSSGPVYTADTHDQRGGTYTVTLTYLAAGFDWDAHYVATFARSGQQRERRLTLDAWLTIANSNGQSFADAQLLAVAGRLEVQSDYRDMAQPPAGKPLRLTCFPFGSSASGVRVPSPARPAPPAYHDAELSDQAITVTAMRRMAAPMAKMEEAVMAAEEALGDLKLYRVPMAVTVAANSQKQVAFLSLKDVQGALVHRVDCEPDVDRREMLAGVVMRTRNVEKAGLGRALPAGGITLFEPSAYGPLPIAEDAVSDYAVGQEVEIAIGGQSRVAAACSLRDEDAAETDLRDGRWHAMQAQITNHSDEDADVEVRLGTASAWGIRRSSRKIALQDGAQVMRVRVAAGSSRTVKWQVRNPEGKPEG